jgi:hypothetical protein
MNTTDAQALFSHIHNRTKDYQVYMLKNYGREESDGKHRTAQVQLRQAKIDRYREMVDGIVPAYFLHIVPNLYASVDTEHSSGCTIIYESSLQVTPWYFVTRFIASDNFNSEKFLTPGGALSELESRALFAARVAGELLHVPVVYERDGWRKTVWKPGA